MISFFTRKKSASNRSSKESKVASDKKITEKPAQTAETVIPKTPRRKSNRFLKFLAVASSFGLAFYTLDADSIADALSASISDMGKPKESPNLDALFVRNPTLKYGFALDTFNVLEQKVKSDDVFSKLLMQHGKVSYLVSDSLEKVIKPSYDFNIIQNGKPYTVLSRDGQKAHYLVYEPDEKRYIIFDFTKEKASVREVKRSVQLHEFEASGVVSGSLWETMVENGMSYQLTDMVEDALKYQIDLRKFKDGDTYKIIWEEEIVEGRSVGVATMKAAYFKKQDEEKPIYALYFDNGKEKGWYSQNGLPMKDGFLKSPLKQSRITSHFSHSRFHPVLHYHKAHYGTDYAAPHGTPILSVADGVISEASSTRGNGNYVKVRHMKPYETQYLHMSRFAKGIKPGVSVKQGQVIGYVGSTGLATGPHVCFRFWKQGTQVDHLKAKLPQVSTFSATDRTKFKEMGNALSSRLDKMSILSDTDIKQQKKLLQALRGKP
jgi:murein DD-endopeptidase MepM/ murein hydrolase activator NlpD